MATDTNGNFYYDANDPTDLVNMEAAKESVKMLQHLQQEDAVKAEQQFMTEGWQEALKDAGIDQQTYNQLTSMDPAFAQGLIKDSMKNLAKSVAKRPRDKDGRFSSTKQPQAQAAQATQPDRTARQAEIVKNRTGSDDEVLELLNTIIDPNSSFFQTS